MKKLLCLIICSFVICASICPIFALNTSSGESSPIGNMERVTGSVPFDFEIVSVGRDSVTAAFVSTGRIADPPYVGIKGTKTVAENPSALQYVLNYDTEYSFVYTVTEGDVKTVYNSFITVYNEGTPAVVFGDVIKNIVDPNSTRGAGQITETEPNDTPETADITFDDFDNYGTMYIYDSGSPSVDTPGDTDYWKVTFNQAGSANFWLGNIPSGCDYDIALFNENGQHMASSANYGQTDELIQANVEANKTYYIAITSYGAVVSSSQYLFRTKNYPPELSIDSVEKIIPESTLLQNSYVQKSICNIACEVTIGYKYPTSSSSPVTFHFEELNTNTVKLASNAYQIVTPSNGYAIAYVTYHVFWGTNFSPTVSVSINGNEVNTISQQIVFSAYESIPYSEQFYLTGYITALESDSEYQSGVMETIQVTDFFMGTSFSLTLDQKFKDAVKHQGSAYLNDGRLIKYYGDTFYVYPSTFVNTGYTGTPVIPFQTCAVDGARVVSINNNYSLLCLEDYGLSLIANDRGTLINDYDIDIYCGAMTMSDFNAQNYPWNNKNTEVSLNGMMGYSTTEQAYYPHT